MKKFLKLTRILLKSGMGDGMIEDNGKSKKKKIIIYILLGLCMVPMVMVMGVLGYEGYELFDGANTHIILGLVCYVSALLTFVLGITMCIGVFFGSSDINILLPLPLRAEQIVGAKFVTLYVYTLFTDFVIFAPVFIGYGVAGEMGAGYYLTALAVMILIPVTPLVYGSIMTMIIIRVFKGVRNKDLLTFFTTAFSIILVLAINTVSNTMSSASQEEIVAMLMEKGTSIIGFMSKVFPNLVFADKALAGNVLNLVLFVISIVAFIVAFLLIANRIYLKSVVEMSAATSKKKKMSNVEFKKANRKKNVVISYAVKELKLAFRTPIYMLNCIGLSILWPVFFLIPMVSGFMSGSDSDEAGTLDKVMEVLEADSQVLGGVCIVAVIAITVFATSFCMLSSTVISREGRNVFFMKYIPMSYKKQYLAKLLPGILISIVTSAGYSVVGMIVFSIVCDISIPVWAVLFAIAISLVLSVLFNIVEIIPDMIKPKLVWETEQAAVKQNFVSIIPMLLIMILGMAGVVGIVLLKVKYDFSVIIMATVFLVSAIVLTVVLYKVGEKIAEKRFALYN